MEKSYTFTPKGVCSRQMVITYDGDTIVSLGVVGGCPGNLQGVSSLVKGRKIDEVISCLDGLKCGGKNTSCPDQLAQALKEIKALKA